MKMNRRRAIERLVAAGALPLAMLPGTSRAQGQKTLRMIVPFTPGTTPDTIARAIGPKMQSRLGMAYTVDNRAGASGMIGMGAVAKADDGTTLMITPSTTLTLPLFYKQVGFDVIKSFTPLTQLVSTSFVLVVNGTVPAGNLQEFIAHAKAKPGLFYSSPGAGTHHHMCMELFKQSAGVQLAHVPYKGAAGAITDFLGGQVAAMFMPIQVAVPHQKDGKLKILGGTLRQRHPAYPEIASLAEQGLKDYEVDPWYGAWGPAGMPAAAAAGYRDAIVEALADAEAKAALAKQGLIIKTTSGDELARLAANEAALWARVVKAANIQPE
jgi:tripartite-type tricarboxylate transporter receptor subunit TctC